MVDSQTTEAYKAQLAASRNLPLHRLKFKLQLQRWWRFHRNLPLVVALEINTDGQRIGLFAELVWVLYALLYIESIGAIPRITVTSKIYSRAGDGTTDYLRQYFIPSWVSQPAPQGWLLTKRISSLAQLPHFAQRTKDLSLWKANALIAQHLPLKQEIEDEVAQFIIDRLASSFIAVHWRGTDKFLEAEPTNVDTIVERVVSVYHSLQPKPTAVFLATDQQDFVSLLSEKLALALPNLPCITRTESHRSTDSQPVHLRLDLSPEDRDLMGKDAIIDCLIMSRSAALIRTASFLSAWCSILNPTLPVFLLNQPHNSKCWFPDAEILHASRFHHERMGSALYLS